MLKLANRWVRSCLCLAAAVVGLGAQAAAVNISQELIALGTPGQYEYRYTVQNESLAEQLTWFSVDFDPSLYEESTLTVTSIGTSDWTEQILASVIVFGVPAQYDAYKTAGAPIAVGETATGFAVAFTWLGVGTPGSQSFTVWNPDTLDVLFTGATVAKQDGGGGGTVPEPSTLALMALAICGIPAGRYKLQGAQRMR